MTSSLLHVGPGPQFALRIRMQSVNIFITSMYNGECDHSLHLIEKVSFLLEPTV